MLLIKNARAVRRVDGTGDLHCTLARFLVFTSYPVNVTSGGTAQALINTCTVHKVHSVGVKTPLLCFVLP